MNLNFPKRPAILFSGIFLTLAVQKSLGVPLISLDFGSEVTAEQALYFQQAADFWNSAITGYDLTHDSNGNTTPHSLSISVSIPTIDGFGGVLGSAGPTQATYYDNNPLGIPTHALYYASSGSMQFDAADVSLMIATGMFHGVVLHEMAHVLGIGTLWSYNNNRAGPGTYQLYDEGSGRYYGANALAAWRSEFSQPDATYVPVELGGGQGTANGHWDEIDGGWGNTGIVSSLTGMDFSRELMTGWASGSFFLSTVTLGSLDDLGYIVDYSKAGLITIPEPSFAMLAPLSLACTLFGRRRISRSC